MKGTGLQRMPEQEQQRQQARDGCVGDSHVR